MLYSSLLWRINTPAKELFVTFDDGPVPGPTEFVLESLEKISAKATFFCIGDNVRKYPSLFSNVINEGHGVGNHTFHHTNGWKTNVAKYVSDVRLCEDEFQKNNVTGKSELKLFRPPYGRIRRSQITALHDYKIIMWDVLSVDYNQRLSEKSCLRNTLEVVRPGSIIVFHDSLKAQRNLKYVLPRFLDACSEKGYTFSRIPS